MGAQEAQASAWVPLSLDEATDATFRVLHDGVPPWMGPALSDWLIWFLKHRGLRSSATNLNWAILELHLSLNAQQLMKAIDRQESICINLIHWALSKLTPEDRVLEDIQEVTKIFDRGSSAWRVVPTDNAYGLERRVDETVTAAAKAVIARGGRPAQHLATSWNSAYSPDPKSSQAYLDAVRAVEAAAIPVLIPNDREATLGRAIGALRDHPEQFSFTLPGSARIQPGNVVLGMLQLLWHSQWDRHGIPDSPEKLTSQGIHASLPEAQAAVHLATTLTEWFTAGHVKRKT